MWFLCCSVICMWGGGLWLWMFGLNIHSAVSRVCNESWLCTTPQTARAPSTDHAFTLSSHKLAGSRTFVGDWPEVKPRPQAPLGFLKCEWFAAAIYFYCIYHKRFSRTHELLHSTSMSPICESVSKNIHQFRNVFIFCLLRH